VGTGHAVLSAKDYVDDNFAVINADDFYGRESYRLIADYLKQPKTGSKAHYCMAGFILKNTLTEKVRSREVSARRIQTTT
jgi:hypothetical protein